MTSGTFTVSVSQGGSVYTSNPIDYRATNADVRAAFLTMAGSLGATEVVVIGPTVLPTTPGEPSGPWQVEFLGGRGASKVGADSSALTPVTVTPPSGPAFQLPAPVAKVTSSYVDPFDPYDIFGQGNPPLFPLIISAGPDQAFDLWGLGPAPPVINYNVARQPPGANPLETNNPYVLAAGTLLGTAIDTNNDGDAVDWADNLSNHLINQN